MRRYFPDEPLPTRVLIAIVGWPALGLLLLLVAFVLVAAAVPHAPSGVALVLVVVALLGTLAFSYHGARTAGWPPSEAIKWGVISLFGTVVMGAGLIVIVGRLFPLGEG
jgi:hypothetical protein